jgi:hypothetical protein
MVPKLEDREVFSRIHASMTQTAHVHASTTTCSAFTVDKVFKVKVKVLCTFFRQNSVSVSNFLRGNRFHCIFFIISLSFTLH